MTYTWDSSFEASPAGDTPLSQGDDSIRGLKAAFRERLNGEHYIGDGSTWDPNNVHGVHRQGAALAYYQASAPSTRPDGTTLADDDYSKGRLWIKSGSKSLWFFDGSDWSYAQQLPVGSILFYTGTWLNDSTIPGWYQCDGTNGTIDLSDKFIVVDGSTYSAGDSEDSPVHHHTGPSHSHTMNAHQHTISAHNHTLGSHTHTVAEHTHDLTAAVAAIDTTVSNFPSKSRGYASSFTANNAGYITHKSDSTSRSSGIALLGSTDGESLTTDAASGNTGDTSLTTVNATSTMQNAGDGDTGDAGAVPPYYCLIAIQRVS